jgi:hypothetical protein
LTRQTYPEELGWPEKQILRAWMTLQTEPKSWGDPTDIDPETLADPKDKSRELG